MFYSKLSICCHKVTVAVFEGIYLLSIFLPFQTCYYYDTNVCPLDLVEMMFRHCNQATGVRLIEMTR